MIHRSPLPDVEIPDLPLTSYVLGGMGGMGGTQDQDKPALIDGVSGQVLTYADLDRAIRSLAGGLVARGFGKGDVLALMAPNVPEYAVVFHGAAMAGGVVTTINPTYTETELRTQLQDSGARILVTIPALAAAAARAGAAEIYVLGEGEAEGARPLADLFGPPLGEHVPVGPDDVVALPYSSGTTGLCKGVMLTHRNMAANVEQILACLQIEPDERFVAVRPWSRSPGSTSSSSFGCIRITRSPGRSWLRPSCSRWPSTRWSTSSTSAGCRRSCAQPRR